MAKKYKCPYCEKRLIRKDLINHIDRRHEELIPQDYTSARVVYDMVNKVSHGTCRVCGKPTKWNEKSGRYDVLCGNPKCKQHMRDEYKKNMLRVRGTYNILNDPEQQKIMLANRKISGSYTFSDGGVLTYTGTYEKNCLEFMDVVMQISSKDILSPGPTLEYEYNGKKHFYITDFYYIPYNLIIEVKDGGDNPNNKSTPGMISSREKTIEKERLITDRGDYNYIRLTNNNFAQLLDIFMVIKQRLLEGDDNKVIKINESTSILNNYFTEFHQREYYRVTYDGIGIYEALRNNVTRDEWINILKSDRITWLPKPPNYEFNNRSYFTKTGYDTFVKKALPLIKKYLNPKKIKVEQCIIVGDIVYEDKYQIVVNVSNTESYISEASNEPNYKYDKITDSKGVNDFYKAMQRCFNIKSDMDEKDVRKSMKVIKLDNKIIGYIGFSRYTIKNKKYLGFGNFMILPEYQRSGYGTSVINDIIEQNKEKYDEIYCYVSKDNTKAINFYKKIAKVGTTLNEDTQYYVCLYKKTDLREESINENMVLNKKDLEINLDKFESGEKNILLITGLSGSGKSTTAKSLASKHNCINYELDCLEFYLRGYLSREEAIGNEDGLIAFIDSKKISTNKDINENEYASLYREYIKFLITWCSKQKNKKFIIEGLQIYETYKDGDSYITCCPMIIKGTSALVSTIRAAKRNGGSFIKQLGPLFKWILKDDKVLDKLRDDMNESYIYEAVDLNRLNAYHLEIVSPEYKDPKNRGGWDGELYSKNMDQAIINDIRYKWSVKNKPVIKAHVYTAGEDLKAIYLGIIIIDMDWKNDSFTWKWFYKEEIKNDIFNTLTSRPIQ